MELYYLLRIKFSLKKHIVISVKTDFDTIDFYFNIDTLKMQWKLLPGQVKITFGYLHSTDAHSRVVNVTNAPLRPLFSRWAPNQEEACSDTPLLSSSFLTLPLFLPPLQAFPNALFCYITCAWILVSGSASREPNLSQSNAAFLYLSRGLPLVVEAYMSLPLWEQNHNQFPAQSKSPVWYHTSHERQHSKTVTIWNRVPTARPGKTAQLSSPGQMSRRYTAVCSGKSLWISALPAEQSRMKYWTTSSLDFLICRKALLDRAFVRLRWGSTIKCAANWQHCINTGCSWHSEQASILCLLGRNNYINLC